MLLEGSVIIQHINYKHSKWEGVSKCKKNMSGNKCLKLKIGTQLYVVMVECLPSSTYFNIKQEL